MARPLRFDPVLGRRIVEYVASGANRGESSEMSGVGLRTVQYWLARGRQGDPPFKDFAEQLERAADRMQMMKNRAR